VSSYEIPDDPPEGFKLVDFARGRLEPTFNTHVGNMYAKRGEKGTRDEFLSLWNEEKPDAVKIAKLLKDRGHIQKTREKGREITDSMLAMIKKLPCKAEATELAFFVEVMAKREF